MRRKMKNDAVSPVVGVMLMLVVTIIIAAVVSVFAGGMGSGTQKAPTIVMDVTIKNTGAAGSSYILFDVKSVSDAIPSKDVKITTTWTAKDGTTGGNVSAGGYNYPNTVQGANTYQSPVGFGKGVTLVTLANQKTSAPYDLGQYFGNYTLTTGTTMQNSPGYKNSEGYGMTTPYSYSYGTDYPSTNIDGVQAVLGKTWNAIRPGDVVNIKMLHIPSGKVIFNKDVVVTG